MIWGVTRELMPQALPRLIPFFENMVEASKGRTTLAEMIQHALGFDLQVWVANDFDAVAITRTWPEAVSIEGCVGTGRENWAEDLERTIRDWGKATGKKHLFINCRPGWARWLKTIGYQEAHREMVVALT